MKEMYDCHLHAQYSPDGRQTTEKILKQAEAIGLAGVCITEHINSCRFDLENTFDRFHAYRDFIARWREEQHPLPFYFGVELGDRYARPKDCDRLLSQMDFDVVMGSVHQPEGFPVSFRRLDLDPPTSNEKIMEHLKGYYSTLIRMVEEDDVDVLAHITLPLRYLNRDHNRGFRWESCKEWIFKTLEILIRRKIALEINTNGWTDEEGYHPLPDFEVMKEYRNMGGTLITIGSDAHQTDRIGKHFETVTDLLKKAGFEGAYYYEKRKPVYYPFPEISSPLAKK